MDVMKKVPVREQAPDVRNKNFDEVCLGYNAGRGYRKKQHVVLIVRMQDAFRDVQYQSIFLNSFINVKEGNFEEAYKVIGKSFSTSSSMWPCMSTGNTVRGSVYKRY